MPGHFRSPKDPITALQFEDVNNVLSCKETNDDPNLLMIKRADCSVLQKVLTQPFIYAMAQIGSPAVWFPSTTAI